MTAFDGDGRIYVIGHRGAAALQPENTLDGFRLAVALGVNAVECDVHITRDGQVVVMHDDDVTRTTAAAGSVSRMSLAEIRQLDAGNGQHVPTLTELLDLLDGRCHLFCELKADGVEEAAAKAVLSREMQGDVTFISFALHRLETIRKSVPQTRIGALLAAPTMKDITRAIDLGVCYIGIHDRYVTPVAIERIRRGGAAAGAWTPNRLDGMLAMIDVGVTHITTDRPDILLAYLGRLNESVGRSIGKSVDAEEDAVS